MPSAGHGLRGLHRPWALGVVVHVSATFAVALVPLLLLVILVPSLLLVCACVSAPYAHSNTQKNVRAHLLILVSSLRSLCHLLVLVTLLRLLLLVLVALLLLVVVVEVMVAAIVVSLFLYSESTIPIRCAWALGV